MAVEIKVPSVGESISEGSISRWLKKDGDAVKRDEGLFELETEKASQEVPSPASGTLRLVKQEGDKVAIGSIVGHIETDGAVGKVDDTSLDGSSSERAQTPPLLAKIAPRDDALEPALSPAARRAVATEKVDPSQVQGTGRSGLILKEDVQRHLETSHQSEKLIVSKASPVSTTGPRETRQRMSSIRQRIAERLLQSQKSTASLTTFNEIDLAAVMSLRAQYKDVFKKKHDVGLGFMSFFVKATIEALKAHPLVNSSIDGGDIVQHHFYNIGVAVSTEKGLMVPVLRDADAMSFAEIEKKITALAEKARTGGVTVGDLQGGTFTITNGGVFGSMLSTPILNPPQSAILGMHAIQKRAVVKDDQIVIRPMMYVALTYDHRLIDGREAVLFLVRIKECLESPERLLLEI